MKPGESDDIPQQVREHLSWKIIPVMLLTGFIVYLLVGHLTDAGAFWEVLQTARWEWFGAALGLTAVILVLQALRFHLVLRAMGYVLSVRRLVGVLLTVWPFVLMAPARINDLLRALKLRDEVPPFSCVGSVVAERFIDIQTICIIGMVGCAWLGAWPWFGLLLAIWLVGWSCVVATVTNVERVVSLPLLNRFEEKIRALLHGFEGLRDKPRYAAATVAVSALVWLGSMGVLWVLLWIFEAPLSAPVILGLWPLALFTGMIPITVGGMGTRDGAFLALLVWAVDWSGAESAVLAATFGYGLVMVLTPGVVGIPFMVRWLFGEASAK